MNKPLAFVKALAAGALVLGVAFSGGAPHATAATTFPQTEQSVWGPFETYWKSHGGVAQFGMARTSVYPVKPGGYDAQYFERALFTYNPKNPDPYKVELQLLGSITTANRSSEQPFTRKSASAQAGSQYFAATGHNLSGKFLEYWNKQGGLPIYGYPISEQFTEKSKSDGKDYLVQYFERNRFEYHPELAGTPYEIQLGLLGSEDLDAHGGPPAFEKLGTPLAYPPATADTGGAPGTYPKMGHAADYSWVAGQVVFTKIQSGCVFIKTDTEQFAPNGAGWDESQVHDGESVVIFGHIAQPGEQFEICPGGRPYIVDRVQANP